MCFCYIKKGKEVRILLNLTVLKSGRIKETFSLNGDTTFQVRIQKDSMQRRGKILALFRTDEKVYTVSDIEAGKVYDIPSECVGKEFSVSIVNDYPGGTSSTGFLLVRTVSSGLSSDDTDTIKQAVTDWLNANPGAVTSLSEEQKNKLKAILLDGDGSSVLSDNGSYIDFAEKVREVIDGNTVDIKDEKVKLTSSSTDAQYLENLIDNATIEVDTANNCLVVRKIDGQTVTVAEINFLTGVKSNVQEQINNLGKAMTMYGVFGTKAELLAAITPVPVDGNTAIVIADEYNDNKQMTYIYIASNSAWTQVAESSVNVRDFSTNPIDLSSETTGTLPKAKIDAAIARLADVLDIATYKGTGNGIVKQADKLTGLTATIAALNQAVSDAHTHANKAVLDKIVSNGIGSGFLADNGEYIEILHIGNTSPTYDSQIWIDNTDSSNIVLKIYDGSKWIAVSGGGSGQSVDLSSYYTKTETDTLLTSKVDAVAGLGLSKESYTTEEKNKLKGLENYDDTAIAGRVTAIEGDYANKTYVGEQIANIDKLTRKIVTSLPSDADADETVIYMLKVTSTNGDEYELYMKIEGTVKLIGNTTIDLSGYAKTTDVNASLDAKVDKVSGKGLSTNDITDTLKAGYDDAVAKAHEHSNKTVLDNLSEDTSGMPLYNGDKFYDGLIANNLTTTDEGYALDARQGNALDSRVTSLETPTFTQAETRANIESQESIPTILGKIKKYFADLKTHAFNALANNLTTTSSGSYALDAYQGKVLNDKMVNLTSIENGVDKVIGTFHGYVMHRYHAVVTGFSDGEQIDVTYMPIKGGCVINMYGVMHYDSNEACIPLGQINQQNGFGCSIGVNASHIPYLIPTSYGRATKIYLFIEYFSAS